MSGRWTANELRWWLSLNGIVAFLSARLGEDEARAQAMKHFTVPEQPYYSCAGSRTEPYGDLEWGEAACDCFLAERKARALREVEAKRAILADYERQRDARIAGSEPGDPLYSFSEQDLLRVVRFLAAIYSDHPDYDPAWAAVSLPVPRDITGTTA